ncbi:MAG: hypothetical protein EPO08_01820 [Rhodospirillaceae bacterium]|nr:MAG: hypothetical protein EPO08_01820 [Rhodospirillaceae bacterium]
MFVWHDLTAGVGGFWRLGQEAVIGKLNSCFGIFTADGVRFRSNVTGVPMVAGDRSETHMGWGSALRVDLDRLAIKADFPGCEASLKFDDFFPRYDWFVLTNRPMPPGQPSHHFEVAGRMTGRVRIDGREIEINALGYRDRSWGGRRWEGLRGTRWWPSVFGPDLCAFTTASIHESGYGGAYGYVIRDGVPYSMTKMDVTATLDYDAISPRAGEARFTLENGETGVLHHTPSDGIVLHVRGYTAVESIGKVRWGDRIGMSNFEVCTNPAGGSQPPVLTLGANNGDGLSRR